MISLLSNHLWQSTLFVLAAWLVAAALRTNGAHIRHRIWVIASLKFLVPFSLLMSLGAMLPRFADAPAPAPAVEASGLAVAVDQIAEPFSDDVIAPAAPAASRPATNWTAVLGGTWVCGFVVIVLIRIRGWRRIRAAVQASKPVDLEHLICLRRADRTSVRGEADREPGPPYVRIAVRSSPGLLEPGVVGLWRPVLLVPAGIETYLTPAQLNAVLAHELCHVRRRDNLTSAIHMAVEAVFWFHPLVWFVGARLVEERERACDEHVLRVCGEPQTYAESILNVCKRYVESPLACVSGVGGADLRKRVAAILVNRVGLRLSLARRVALAIVAVLAIVLPLAAGMLIKPLSASTSSYVGRTFRSGSLGGPEGPPPVPQKFDVVSVKPCEPNAPSQTRGGGGTPITSPGRLYLQCYPLSTMITEAYLYFADGRAHGLDAVISVGVEGGADWMKSERYLVEAKTGQAPAAAVMRGPMLQAVLEDRFKLKVRRVTREVPVTELVAAKSGAKVAPYTGHDCVIKDNALWPPAALPAGQRYCGDRSRPEGDRLIREGVMTLDELASLLNFDPPLVNRTGITAPVSYRFEYSLEDERGNRQAAIVAGLKNELGLDVRVAKGPRDFLVIDHAERPAPDSPAPGALTGDGVGASRQASGRSRGSGLPFAAAVLAHPGSASSAKADATAGQAASKFDVVSIKPCDPKAPFTRRGDPPPRGFRGGGAPYQAYVSPGHAYWDCVTLAQLVDQAYADQAHPLLNIVDQPRQNQFSNQPKRVRGGPAWVETDKFSIEATASVDVTSPGLAGSSSKYLPTLPAGLSLALRAVLEDRFKAKVHRATEQQDMYALTIGSTGLNKKTMTSPVSGDCKTVAEYSAAVAAGELPGTICGRAFSSVERGMEYSSFTLQQLAHDLSTQLDHFVLDRTGVETPFNFTIKAEPATEGDGARYARALGALGLKLESVKGPAEYLVIDSVEKPRPNPPAPIAPDGRGFGAAGQSAAQGDGVDR